MRKIYLALVILSTICLGCSSNENDVSEVQVDSIIVGDWIEFQESYTVNNGNEILRLSYPDNDATTTFRNDGSLFVRDKSHNNYITYKGSWEILENGNCKIVFITSINHPIGNSGIRNEYNEKIEFICDKNMFKLQQYGSENVNRYTYFTKVGYNRENCSEHIID